MDDKVRVERARSNGVREEVERFLGARLPEGFEVSPSQRIRMLDKVALESLMLEHAPFYFIDRAVAIADESGVFRTVFGIAEMTEDRVAGHFPSRPIVPLILLCMSMAQTGIALAALQGSEKAVPIAISAGASKATAKDLIDAPATILTEVTLTASRMQLYFVDGTSYVVDENGSHEIGKLERIVYTLIDREELVLRGRAENAR